jgi:hypothetical protein
MNVGIDKVFNFDGAFDRVPVSADSSPQTVFSFGYSLTGQRRIRNPGPQSDALIFAPSASWVISEQWNASLAAPITRRWFNGASRDLTVDPVGVLEYIIPANWVGGPRGTAILGNPSVDFLVFHERNWSTDSSSNMASGSSALSSRQDGAFRSGSKIMDGKGSRVVRRVLPFLLVAAYTPLVSISPLQAAGPTTAAAAASPGDGVWSVQGRAIPGRRQCGDWLVRLTNRQGQLSGVVSLARASVPIQDLTLLPDGSFSGTTRPGMVGTSHARAYKVSGRFSGDAVNLTLQDNLCPPRRGAATRQGGGG